MSENNLFTDVADLLEVISSDYKYGIGKTESLPSLSLKSLKSFTENSQSTFYGNNNALDVVFIFSYRNSNINDFLETEDGNLFTKLLANTSFGYEKINLAKVAVVLTEVIEDSFIKSLKSLLSKNKASKVIFFGEEFQEEILVEFEESDSFLFTPSFQEIRNSVKIKKVFWTNYQSYLS